MLSLILWLKPVGTVGDINVRWPVYRLWRNVKEAVEDKEVCLSEGAANEEWIYSTFIRLIE